MEMRPDQKLFTKQWMILLTICIFVALLGLILQLLIPLNPRVNPSQVAVIVWPIAFGVAALLWIIVAPLVALWIKNLTYFIEDDRVVIHKGILTKVQQNIPFRAITDFMLHRSLYDRWLGIGAIRIQTAGQSQSATGYEGQLAGLLNWEELHGELRGRLSQVRSSVEPGGMEAAAAPAGLEQKLEEMLVELRAIREAVSREQ